VIGVVLGFKIENQWRESQSAQCGCPKDRTLKTGRGSVQQDLPGRRRRQRKIVRQFIQEFLDAAWRLQLPQEAKLGFRPTGIRGGTLQS
jgi:hypothetical protein